MPEDPAQADPTPPAGPAAERQAPRRPRRRLPILLFVGDEIDDEPLSFLEFDHDRD